MKKLSLLLNLALVAFCTTGCDLSSLIDKISYPDGNKEDKGNEDTKPGEKDDDVKVNFVVLEEYETTLYVAETYQIEASVLPAEASQDVTYKALDEEIISVSSEGLITAKVKGDTSVTVTSVADTTKSTILDVSVLEREEKTTYTVSFHPNGGEGNMEKVVIEEDSYEVPLSGYTYPGFAFVCWALNSPDGETFEPGDVIEDIDRDFTLYAVWEEYTDIEQDYKVTLNSNNGSGGLLFEETDGSYYETPLCTFTYEGHEFSHWALNSINGTSFAEESEIEGITSDIVLYAIWEEVLPPSPTNYTVTLYANNGTSSTLTEKTNGSTYTIPVCSFSYDGHTFDGWAYGSKDGVEYAAGDVLKNIESDIKLYALWTANSSDPNKIDDNYGNYYASIDDSLTGTDLRNALNSLNSSKRKRTMSYDGLKTWGKYTEVDWTGKDNTSGKMFGFYDNAKVSNVWDNQATWNREHVWPKSRGGGLVDKDMHMPRPASVKINSSRGNMFFGTASSTYDPGQYEVNYRGVAARIIFYCAIADKSLSLVDSNDDSTSNKSMGKLSELLSWNLQYAPDTSADAHLTLRIEQNRNREMYRNENLQGNRNPFVDHPEYACRIWGSTNSTTKSICGIK